MMFGFVSYADAEPGYVPEPRTRRRGGQDLERIKQLVKQRFGLDWDSMDGEQREEVIQRLRRGQGASSGD